MELNCDLGVEKRGVKGGLVLSFRLKRSRYFVCPSVCFFLWKSALGRISLILFVCLNSFFSLARADFNDAERVQPWPRQVLPQLDERVALGRVFLTGIGVERDFIKGINLLKDAAEDGILRAMYLYAQHRLIPLWPIYDPNEGVLWMHRAAEQGSISAMSYLAQQYYLGGHFPADPILFRYWENMVFELGSPNAASDLIGWFILFGVHPEENGERLNRLLALAQKGELAAKTWLGLLLRDGFGGEERVEEGIAWTREAAELGSSLSQIELGDMLARGNGVPQDLEEARQWYLRPIEHGNTIAMWRLGRLLFRPDWPGGPDLEASFEWTLRAAEGGLDQAQKEVAPRYQYGMGVEANLERARYWVGRAAETNSEEFLFELGINLWDGYMIFQDSPWGEALVTRVAETGYFPAQLELVRRYGLGIGPDQDLEKSWSWAQRLVEPNSPEETSRTAQIFLAISGPDPRFRDMARQYLWSAVEQSVPEAQYILGKFILLGMNNFRMGPEGEAGGTYWINMAAEQGFDPDGTPPERGTGVSPEEMADPTDRLETP